ncbi:MAG: glutamine--fructose-6-phosphate aminotransferase, partial [Bacteroidetes bacterium]|nr:glutamine--fructose-6-phosphate aminotransferase [Bacteroidota bacterium]
MCGIVAYIGKKDAFAIILKGLKQLEYRGYDSAGVALLHNGALNIYKRAGKVSVLEEYARQCDIQGHAGIGHTRWATHGLPNDINAHPHYS